MDNNGMRNAIENDGDIFATTKDTSTMERAQEQAVSDAKVIASIYRGQSAVDVVGRMAVQPGGIDRTTVLDVCNRPGQYGVSLRMGLTDLDPARLIWTLGRGARAIGMRGWYWDVRIVLSDGAEVIWTPETSNSAKATGNRTITRWEIGNVRQSPASVTDSVWSKNGRYHHNCAIVRDSIAKAAMPAVAETPAVATPEPTVDAAAVETETVAVADTPVVTVPSKRSKRGSK